MSTRRVTRRQAQAWLDPIRKCLRDMRSGYCNAARGYAVTRLNDSEDWVRTDYCIAGFRALIARFFPSLSTAHMERIQRRLAAGVLVSVAALSGIERLTWMLDNLKAAQSSASLALEAERKGGA